MKKIDAARKNGFKSRAFLRAGLILGAMAFAGALSVPSAAVSAEASAKGKKVGYITFGLQFEYQVAMVAGIQKKADAA
jgi:ribose transport system substrate-binding protein